MNCKDLHTQMELMLDEELTGDECLEFNSHLQNCTDCDTRYAAARSLKTLLRDKLIRKTANEALLQEVRGVLAAS